VAGIDDWDEPALTALHDAGKASASELAERIEIDQFDKGMARAWINDALGRRLIRQVKDSSKSRQYEITEKGSARIGRPLPDPEEPGEDAGD
jgi:hypothetical protein